MNRREFLQLSSLAAGAGRLTAFAATQKKYATDRIRLGPSGVEVSRLAMGSGTNGVGKSSNQLRKLGEKGLAELLRAAYDQGITFWDSADQYGSHGALRLALKGLPREKITILTKTHATTAAEMRADLDRFRRELGTDYIDILLLHFMRDPNWPEIKKPAMEVISEAKEKGIVRTHGVSCHTLGALEAAAKHPWVEVDLARVNPAGVLMDADPAKVLEVLKRMKAAGKGIIGMKIFGAGILRLRADEALQWTLSHPEVDCFTIGCESRREFEDLLKKIPAASVRG